MTRLTLASVCLTAALWTQAGYAQVTTTASVQPATTTTPVAYVYVSTSKGTDLYDAASNGKLTLVSGSPFPTSGFMVGSNGKYLITAGTDDIYSYKIASNGAIEGKVSELDTQSFSGGKCGATAGAVLDHSGKDVYVSLKGAPADDGNELCDALQSSSISSSSGTFTFKGDVLVDEDSKNLRVRHLASIAWEQCLCLQSGRCYRQLRADHQHIRSREQRGAGVCRRPRCEVSRGTVRGLLLLPVVSVAR